MLSSLWHTKHSCIILFYSYSFAEKAGWRGLSPLCCSRNGGPVSEGCILYDTWMPAQSKDGSLFIYWKERFTKKRDREKYLSFAHPQVAWKPGAEPIGSQQLLLGLPHRGSVLGHPPLHWAGSCSEVKQSGLKLVSIWDVDTEGRGLASSTINPTSSHFLKTCKRILGKSCQNILSKIY